MLSPQRCPLTLVMANGAKKTTNFVVISLIEHDILIPVDW